MQEGEGAPAANAAVHAEHLGRRRPRAKHARLAPGHVDALVQAFLAAGGQITVCPPGDATATRPRGIADRLHRAAQLLAEEGQGRS